LWWGLQPDWAGLCVLTIILIITMTILMIITMIKMTMQQQIAFVKPLGNLLKHNLYWYLKNNTRGPWHWSFCPNQSIWGNAGVTVASVKTTFCSKISSQTFYFSSFSFFWDLNRVKTWLCRRVPRNTTFLHWTLQFLLPYQLFQIFCSNCVSYGL